MKRLPASRRPARVREVIEALDLLPERERQALALLLVERLTVLEAAGAMHTTMREVGELYATALQRIVRGTVVRAQRKAA